MHIALFPELLQDFLSLVHLIPATEQTNREIKATASDLDELRDISFCNDAFADQNVLHVQHQQTTVQNYRKLRGLPQTKRRNI